MPGRKENISSELKKLEAVRQYIIKDISAHHTISTLSRLFKLNEFKLKTEFKKRYDLSIYKYLEEQRMQLALELLSTTKHTVNIIAVKCGYAYATNFVATFRKNFNVTPDAYREESYDPYIIDQAAALMKKYLHRHYTAEILSKHYNLSKQRIMTGFKKKFDMEVYEYLKFLRMERVKELILQGKTIAAILPLVGYTSKEAVYLGFKSVYKQSLESWRVKAFHQKTHNFQVPNNYPQKVKAGKVATLQDDSVGYYYSMTTP
jgi:AraC-like DNA-binding protein